MGVLLLSKLSMYDYEKVLSELKQRGYMLVIDKVPAVDIASLNVVSKEKGVGFVHKYVWLTWDITFNFELEFSVDCAMDETLFCKLSVKDLNAIAKARNDLKYFCGLLNKLHIPVLEGQNCVSADVLNKFKSAARNVGATVMINVKSNYYTGSWE